MLFATIHNNILGSTECVEAFVFGCRAAAIVETCCYHLLLMTRLYTTEQVICIRVRLSVAVSAIFSIMFSVTTSVDTVSQLGAISFWRFYMLL